MRVTCTTIALCLLLAYPALAPGDDLPVPPYPAAALHAHQGGKVGITVTYDDHGAVASVDIKSSSGVPLLDATTKKFVLAHWQNPALANQSRDYFMRFDPSNPGPFVENDSPPVNIDPDSLTATLPSSPTPRETALALYKKHIQAVLEYYWSYEVKRHAADLEAGTVKLRYVIHSDGSISDITVIEGDNFEVLKQVGKDVLVSGTPYRPFTSDVIAEVGDQYTDTRTFTISR